MTDDKTQVQKLTRACIGHTGAYIGDVWTLMSKSVSHHSLCNITIVELEIIINKGVPQTNKLTINTLYFIFFLIFSPSAIGGVTISVSVIAAISVIPVVLIIVLVGIIIGVFIYIRYRKQKYMDTCRYEIDINNKKWFVILWCNGALFMKVDSPHDAVPNMFEHYVA